MSVGSPYELKDIKNIKTGNNIDDDVKLANNDEKKVNDEDVMEIEQKDKAQESVPGKNNEEKSGDESDSCGEDEYVVEKIIKKRQVNGKTEYFIKWKDWPASTNTWEPVEHLSCEEKVKEFEEKLTATKAAQAAARKKTKEFSLPQSEIGYGFDRQLEPEKILAATDRGGALKFVMKWKNREKPDVVLAAEANMKCPQIVIKFYEDRLTWTNASVPTAKEESAMAQQQEQQQSESKASETTL